MIFLLKMLFSKIKLTNVVSKEIRRQVYHRLMKKDWKKIIKSNGNLYFGNSDEHSKI